MKVTFRWLDYQDDKRAWTELVFDIWGEEDPVPRLGEVVRLQWPKDGKDVAWSGTVKEVHWTVAVRDSLPRKISAVITLG